MRGPSGVPQALQKLPPALAALMSGFVDYLKKRLSAVRVVSDKTVTLPGASSARLFMAGGTVDSGRVRHLDVLLVVRDDTL